MPYNIQDFHRHFRSNNQCLQYLFEQRFFDVTCPKCKRHNAYHKHPTKLCYTCNCGRYHIYPKKGTIFEQSHVPLAKWLYAIFLVHQSGDRISMKEIGERIKVTYPTAWRMTKKIRAAIPQTVLHDKTHNFESVLQYCMGKIPASSKRR